MDGPRGTGRYRSHHDGDDRTRRRGQGGEEQRQPSIDRQPPAPPPSTSSAAALDFLSPSFDAALALSTPGLLPPDPRAPILDNVTACRRLLPPGAEGAFAEAERPLAAAQAAAAAKKPPRPLTTAAAAAARQGSGVRPERVPALEAIARASLGSAAEGGPLALLKRALDSRRKVRVLTRHARGVRGSAVGTLCGFDVYMNLILKDVVEEYRVRVPVTRERPPRRRQVAGGEEGEEMEGEGGGKKEEEETRRRRLRHCYRLESRTRSLRLVFLRGDSVVLVSSSVGP